MSVRKKCLLIAGFMLIACRERTSMFDPRSDDFVSPPAMYDCFGVGGWYNYEGYLVGIKIQVEFIDESSRSLRLVNYMCRGGNILASAGVTVSQGANTYQVDLISETIMTAGEDYCVKVYFGEIAIGAMPFAVVSGSNGQLFIAGISEYDTLYVR